jgi:glycosyltransferase involved in cell wall biosynthesis
MHICMIAREFPPRAAGIGYHVFYLSKKLLQRGHEVDVITRRYPEESTTELMDGIRVFRLPYKWSIHSLNFFLHGVSVNALLKSLEPKLTLVHLHSPLPPLINTTLPVILTVHSPIKRAFQKTYRDTRNMYSFAEQLQSMIVYSHVESKIFKISKKIVSVSSNVRDELGTYGLNPQTITVVGNAVDERLFVPKKLKNNTFPYVLFVGILRSGKGVFDLVACANLVCNKRPDVRFVICGRGALLKSLEAQVLKMGLREHVVFLGYETNREHLVKLYQNATLLVQPSYHEGLSTVVLEAMSCGLPVVANDIAGNRSVISSGINGILVPPKSPAAMARSILELLDDVRFRERLGRAARNTIENCFTWDRIADNMIECYEELLQDEKN